MTRRFIASIGFGLSILGCSSSNGGAAQSASGGSSTAMGGGAAVAANASGGTSSSVANSGTANSFSGSGGAPGNGGPAPMDGGAGGSVAMAMGGVANTGGQGGASGNSGGAGGSTGVSAAGSGGALTGIDVAQPSMGCGTPADIVPGDYQQSTVGGRSVWVRLPDGYDEHRAYPIIFVWKGCGGAGQLSIFRMEQVAGADAIIVHGDVGPGMDCYDTADGAMFVDLPFFDTFYDYVTSHYCVDKAHAFSAGFSSGAWLTFFLGCQRANELRAIGTIAGGFKPTFFLGQPQCVGKSAAFMVSDLSDTTNPFHDLDSDGDSVEIGLNQWLTFNGCSETTWTETAGTPADPDPNICRTYAGCGDYPVELCLTTGVGHADQASLSVPGFWAFFSQFLPK